MPCVVQVSLGLVELALLEPLELLNTRPTQSAHVCAFHALL